MSNTTQVPQLGRIAFAKGVFAYPAQRPGQKSGPRDVLVWCTCCRASLRVDGQAEHKTEIGMLWQRVHNNSTVKGEHGDYPCPFMYRYIVEIPQ